MKRFKKLLLGLVAFAAMAVLCAVCVGAETAGDYDYTVLDDGTVKITRYNGTADILRIPDTISGKSVTVLGNSSFGYKNFTELYIPGSITSIEQKAFYYCRKFTSVKIPSSVEIIYEYAFQNCTALETLTVSEGVTRICDYAFQDCTKLSSVSLPDSMRRIGQKAFDGTAIVDDQTTQIKYVDKWAVQCDSGYPTDLTISGAVGIADRVFTVVKGSLKKVVINDGVKYIGESAFAGCTLLNDLTLPAGLEYINNGAFMDCKMLMSIVLPKGLKSIDGAFEFCTALVSIEIPEGLSEIGKRTFYGCRSLKSVTIPESVTAIGENAFYNCTSLSSVTLPSKLKTIDQNAFLHCTSLKSITIPKSVTDISLYALGYSERFKQFSDFKIYCYSGTTGEYYAKRNNFDYELLGHTTHSYGAWTTTKAATCAQEGERTRTCSCGDTQTETIAKTAHKYTTTIVPATTTSQGYTLHKCPICGDSYKDNYTDKLTLPAVTGLKLGGRASNALRLNWNKNTSADGYIIEQYKSGKWVRIAKISSNATTTYRVSGLSAGTAYKFRMRAYKMSGSTAIYSAYTSALSARTNPSNVTGVKIGGKASNALRVNWTKNTSANGYIVEIYKSGKWVRAAKITKNTTVTYRISGLAKNTTYKIRIKAYKMSGSTALYSGYTTISGKTTA